MLTTLEAELGF